MSLSGFNRLSTFGGPHYLAKMSNTDPTQALRNTENAIRDFIAQVLESELGADWIERCGVTRERIKKWRERKASEDQCLATGALDERLLYYADFYDIQTILRKHWTHFAPALGDWKTFEVWWSELEKLRDSDAHRRQLLPHQRNLVLGIAGEIGASLVRYRSKAETSEDYYPRIESVHESLGHLWTPASGAKQVETGAKLRPGDSLNS